ncbi:MAG: hypothetical protein JXR29_05415 [Methylothermaceae bacterium]|nr:hypothetical protein [Methylothermaceae bacterium]
MSISLQDKRRLMLAYEPMLLLQRRDAENAPVDFRSFLEQSGLWSSIGSGSALTEDDIRLRWGMPKNGAFPRTPEREAGEITLDPAGFDDNFLVTIGDNTAEIPSKFFFLSTGAWASDGAPQLAGSDLFAGIVAEGTPVVSANLPALWDHFGFRPDGDAATPAERMPILHRYSVDVVEYADLHHAPRIRPEHLFSGNLEPLGENPVFLFYHYLFPTHEERLSTAELTALAMALARDEPEASVGEILEDFFDLIFGEGSVEEVPPGSAPPSFGRHTKSYAGDMQCVCVVIPTPETDADGQVSLPDDDAALPAPFVVGFGRRLRSLRQEIDLGHGVTTRTQQQMRATMSFEAVDRHPVVYVAGGTHNFYASSGDDGVWPLNVNPSGLPVPTVSPDDTTPPEQDDLREWAVLTSILKFLTFGFIGGAYASALEAGGEGEIPGTGENADQPGSDATDSVPLGPSDEDTIVIAPPGTLPPSDNVRFWRQGVADADRESAELSDIIQDNQPWWPYSLNPLIDGFEGRWGVDCTDDPFDARRGTFYPNFREKLVEALIPLIL